MQTRSGVWLQALKGRYRVESRVAVGGVTYSVSVPDSAEPSPVQKCRISHALFTSDALIGNACAAIMEMTFIPTEKPPTAAQILLESRLIAEDGTATEWLPRGTYWLDERDDSYHGRLSIVAYDRMLFAEADWFPDGVISGTWPKPAPEVVDMICQRLGVELDERSVIDESVMVAVPIGKTLRNTLMEIAAAHGGNFTMTPANRLRLVLLPEPITQAYLGDENGSYVVDETGAYIVLLSGEFHDVQYSCGGYSRLGDKISVTGVELILDDDYSYKSGADGYYVSGECSFATEDTPLVALANLVGRPFMPFRANQVQLDPAAELGDRIMVAGDSSLIGSMTINVGAAYLAEVSAPITGEVNHEIPFKNRAQQLINRKVAEARAEIKITTDSIQSQVTGIDDGLSMLEQTVDTITLEVSNGTDRSTITLKKNGVAIESETVRFTGNVIFESDLTDDSTVISGDCIQTGMILAEYLKLGGPMEVFRTTTSTTMAGFLGYITGMDANGNKTTGMGMMDPDENNQIVVTDGGARMNSPTAEVVCATNVTLEAPFNAVNIYANKFTSDVDLTVSSDRNAKDEIQYDVTEKYLAIFDRLMPASFLLKNKPAVRHLGFIAQDVESAMNGAGVDHADFAVLSIDENGKYGLNYSEFIPMLVSKIQQLEGRISDLEAKLNG